MATTPHGVLVVDKPSGPTSHDVVAGARRVYGTRAVGHAGTLDPMASGVLVLMFGEACKLSQHLTASSKRYRAEVRFGSSTDTLDAQGQVVEERALTPGWLDTSKLAGAIAHELARTLQEPPAVSAIKVDGERAYRAARRGESVTLPARAVSVTTLTLHAASDSELALELEVSKGYYVRALARDLGRHLAVPAHLASLRRTASGAFTLDDAVTWPLDAPHPLLTVVEGARRALPCATVSDEGVARARTGRSLTASHFPGDVVGEDVTAWLSTAGQLVALGQRNESGEYRVVRGFSAAQS